MWEGEGGGGAGVLMDELCPCLYVLSQYNNMWECPEINTSSCERIHYCSNESILVQGESAEQDRSSTDRMLARSRRTVLLLLLRNARKMAGGRVGSGLRD